MNMLSMCKAKECLMMFSKAKARFILNMDFAKTFFRKIVNNPVFLLNQTAD
tara:strand:- start:499 stop:651 length:153 start_codon:yes stop_codon:yes gene_type:complete